MALTIWALAATFLLGVILALIADRFPGAQRWERRRVIVGIPLLIAFVAIYLAVALLTSIIFPGLPATLITLFLATSCIAIISVTILGPE